jgi:predicted short-subunit dehydrogenase-like oxidoreductase (DUF2520 family)
MRAWQEPDPDDEAVRAAAAEKRVTDRERAADHERTLQEIQGAGVDLDPVGERRAAHHDRLHAEGPRHAHPHPRREPGEPPLTGIVGAGAVGTALGLALSRAGWPITALASRDRARRERFRSLVPGVRAFAEPTALLDEVELVILSVPDDAIAAVAAGLRLYSGQALVHTSGLLGAEVLAPAMAAGTQVGSFHPLVAFADTERAVAALRGATIAVEGDDDLVALLADMAEAVGGTAVRLAPGVKAAYHAAAVLAAGGVVALLDAIVELGRVVGLDESATLAVYEPLIRQTLDNASALGVRAALTGPFTRGDVGTTTAHLAALEKHAPDVVELYRALGSRELRLAGERGSLTPEAAARLADSLAKRA